ncbi:gluconolactonase [Aporhodopirellula aestuarii]|uniref:Gluconolactonase n=1 Tax=Aporhodopirellula aestuarii TaxID=2950107 RepID=A0ABT0U665_9BACT|nr:gluconolactonase [Aporhodopirellula aestuarii]MCM2372375.1 gluconolactonase [Aporhodopirellula aestuarii]
MKFALNRPFSTLVIAVCLASFATVAAVAVGDEAPAAASPTKVTVFESGTLVVPPEFKPAPKANNIIEHEFAASAGEGDNVETARVTMMPASGGVKANIDRWIGQFSSTDRKTVGPKETESGGWTVHVVEVSGQYSERMGGGPFAGGRVVRREGYAMMGAILVEPEGDAPHRRQYFVKMIGPESVIKANGEAFKKMVNSVGQ